MVGMSGGVELGIGELSGVGEASGVLKMSGVAVAGCSSSAGRVGIMRVFT